MAAHVRLYSRNQKDFRKRVPPIIEALAELKRPAILDSKIVALDEHGHTRFEWLVNRGSQRGTLVYYVFDLLMLDGKDLRQLSLMKRKQRLGRLLTGHLRLLEVEHIERDGLSIFAAALALGWKPYVEGPGVTWHWQKIRIGSISGRRRWNSGKRANGFQTELRVALPP